MIVAVQVVCKWQAKKAHVELFAALLRSKKLYCGGNEDMSCCCPKCLRGGRLRSELLETRWSHSLHGEVLASDEQILQRRLLWLGLKLKATCEAEKMHERKFLWLLLLRLFRCACQEVAS